MFRVIAPKIADRPGGYTRILKTGFRLGDGAEMCIIEFVDFNETYKEGAAVVSTEKPKTRRSRKSSSAAKEATDGVSEAVVVEEGEKKAAPAKKTAAKKPAAPKTTAPKTSGSKAAATRSAASKKA